MAAVSSQGLSSAALTTPSAITPAASDTIAEAQMGANGCVMRIITTGTATDVEVTDPGRSPLGNVGDSLPLTCPATGARLLLIPRAALNASGQVTVTFSGALTGVTYELIRV